MQPDHSQPSPSQPLPDNIRLWCCTRRSSTPNVQYSPSVRRRGLSVLEIYFCHLRGTLLVWESLPHSSLLPTKLATRLTHLGLI
ncbi:hypothetical protein [Lyngbya sp. PCC 8106]|uniref:hypothetical protein n=1 Tax=Lyngbya sp. (strain PCC 8106) TaxID=313612 RepID=UPI0012E9DE6F|nr:hypothetical protein [Lyngbya sp. PCC 8106]